MKKVLGNATQMVNFMKDPLHKHTKEQNNPELTPEQRADNLPTSRNPVACRRTSEPEEGGLWEHLGTCLVVRWVLGVTSGVGSPAAHFMA